MSKWIVNGLAVAIITMWIGSLVVSFVRSDYEPPASIQWALSILAGAAFGKAVVYGAGYDDDDSRSKRP